MYQRSETFFTGHDGVKLFLQKWIHPEAKGTILFTHGQAEHSECYQRLIQAFSDQHWNFVGWDLRGHGRSEGLRGYAKDFDDYVLDYKIFIDICLNLPELHNHPITLLGHSMGGLIQTCYLIEKSNTRFTAQVLSSPFFEVAVHVPKWKDSGAGFLNSLLPKVTLGNEIKNSDLTRDIEIMREYEQDTYRHNRISSGVYLGFKREFPKIQARAAEIKIPTLLHISDKDPIVSSDAAIQFFDKISSSNKVLKIVEGGKHELYNDTVRAEVYKTVIDYLKPFISR